MSGFHRDDLLRHGKSELKFQYFTISQRLVAFEIAYSPANRIVSFTMPAEQQLGLLAVCLNGWHRHIPAENFFSGRAWPFRQDADVPHREQQYARPERNRPSKQITR